MAITLSNAFVAALLAHDATAGQSAVADQIGGGTLVVYTSPTPAGPNEADTGSTLATFTFSAATAQGTPSAGSMTIAFANQTVTAGASGTADHFRIISSVANGSNPLIQGTIGTSGADWNLSSVTITNGDQVSITGTPTISWVTS